jgi:hypothetical protein
MRTCPLLVVRCLVVVAAVLAHPRVGAAQVAVIVGGEATGATRTKMVAAANQALLDNQQEPGIQDFEAKEIDGIVQCVSSVTSKDCSAAFMARLTATRAIVIQVGRDGPEKKAPIVLTGWVVAKVGTRLAMRDRFCEPCSTAKLEESAGVLVGELLRETEARTTKTWLLLRTIPAGAEVELDGALIGRTELKHAILAGPHRIVMQLRGYEIATREVTAVAGETATVDVTLKPVAKKPAPPFPEGTAPDAERGAGRSSMLRWAPWAVVGAGAAVTAVGVTLLVRDEGSRAPDGSLRFERRETTAFGAVSTGVGVTAIAAGLLWYFWQRDGDDPATGPSLQAARGGAVLGYTGRF